MKKLPLLFVALMSLAGCGPSIQELMATQPALTKTLDKDAYCVYNKLQIKTIKHPNANLFWTYGWDSSIEKGELIWNNYPHLLAIYNIYRDKDKTVVDVRNTWRGGEPSLLFVTTTDFSSCPDIAK